MLSMTVVSWRGICVMNGFPIALNGSIIYPVISFLLITMVTNVWRERNCMLISKRRRYWRLCRKIIIKIVSRDGYFSVKIPFRRDRNSIGFMKVISWRSMNRCHVRSGRRRWSLVIWSKRLNRRRVPLVVTGWRRRIRDLRAIHEDTSLSWRLNSNPWRHSICPACLTSRCSLSILSSSRSVLIVWMILHVLYSKSFSLFHERPSILRRQTLPSNSWVGRKYKRID